MVEASSVSLPSSDAETLFGVELDWLAASRASVTPVSVVAEAAWWTLTAEDALKILAAESGAPVARERESAEEQEESLSWAVRWELLGRERASVREATGTAERDAAMAMLQDIPGREHVTVGGDKGFDTAEFVRECRNMRVTPHVAQRLARRGGSAIDGRTTQHESYGNSQKKRKRVEECFGWLKTIALLRKVRHRGTLKVD